MPAGARLRIGLTGGKSTVARLLAGHGAAVIDTDAIARELSLPGGAAIEPIRQGFGAAFIDATGALDRAHMRALAFSDPASKRRLEAILHPLISVETEARAQAALERVLVFDVPLLVESARWRARVHKVLVVDCREQTQVERVVTRSGWTPQAVQAAAAARLCRRRGFQRRPVARRAEPACPGARGALVRAARLKATTAWHERGAVEQSFGSVHAKPTAPGALIRYEFPFNESIRTLLRLEHLFDRLGQLVVRDAALDHHHALSTLFEIMDVAARADLKSDLLKDLERQRLRLNGFRDNPSVAQPVLNEVAGRIDSAFRALNQMPGKAGAALTANEWLMSIRSRISIPGGTCGFDLPAYYAWQQFDPQRRRTDLLQWSASLTPLADALRLLLTLLRDSGAPHPVVAVAGLFQQSLPAGRTCQLLRLRLKDVPDLVPEISGHRLMVSVRLMQQDGEGRLKPSPADTPMELTLCL